jgi:hypothetical protein
MSGLQNFLIKILPQSWAQGMEAESRSWMLRCNVCGTERSVWDTGGTRWKASGHTSRMMRCPQCGKLTLHTMYRKQSSGAIHRAPTRHPRENGHESSFVYLYPQNRLVG